MDGEILLGCFIGGGALMLITILVLWGRRTIDQIARRGPGSAREILRELRGGR